MIKTTCIKTRAKEIRVSRNTNTRHEHASTPASKEEMSEQLGEHNMLATANNTDYHTTTGTHLLTTKNDKEAYSSSSSMGHDEYSCTHEARAEIHLLMLTGPNHRLNPFDVANTLSHVSMTPTAKGANAELAGTQRKGAPGIFAIVHRTTQLIDALAYNSMWRKAHNIDTITQTSKQIYQIARSTILSVTNMTKPTEKRDREIASSPYVCLEVRLPYDTVENLLAAHAALADKNQPPPLSSLPHTQEPGSQCFINSICMTTTDFVPPNCTSGQGVKTLAATRTNFLLMNRTIEYIKRMAEEESDETAKANLLHCVEKINFSMFLGPTNTDLQALETRLNLQERLLQDATECLPAHMQNSLFIPHPLVSHKMQLTSVSDLAMSVLVWLGNATIVMKQPYSYLPDYTNEKHYALILWSYKGTLMRLMGMSDEDAIIVDPQGNNEILTKAFFGRVTDKVDVEALTEYLSRRSGYWSDRLVEMKRNMDAMDAHLEPARIRIADTLRACAHMVGYMPAIMSNSAHLETFRLLLAETMALTVVATRLHDDKGLSLLRWSSMAASKTVADTVPMRAFGCHVKVSERVKQMQPASQSERATRANDVSTQTTTSTRQPDEDGVVRGGRGRPRTNFKSTHRMPRNPSFWGTAVIMMEEAYHMNSIFYPVREIPRLSDTLDMQFHAYYHSHTQREPGIEDKKTHRQNKILCNSILPTILALPLTNEQDIEEMSAATLVLMNSFACTAQQHAPAEATTAHVTPSVQQRSMAPTAPSDTQPHSESVHSGLGEGGLGHTPNEAGHAPTAETTEKSKAVYDVMTDGPDQEQSEWDPDVFACADKEPEGSAETVVMIVEEDMLEVDHTEEQDSIWTNE